MLYNPQLYGSPLLLPQRGQKESGSSQRLLIPIPINFIFPTYLSVHVRITTRTTTKTSKLDSFYSDYFFWTIYNSPMCMLLLRLVSSILYIFIKTNIVYKTIMITLIYIYIYV